MHGTSGHKSTAARRRSKCEWRSVPDIKGDLQKTDEAKGSVGQIQDSMLEWNGRRDGSKEKEG